MTSKQNLIEQVLDYFAENGYTSNSIEFLKDVSKYLAKLFKVDYVLIDKYSIKTPNIVETIALYRKGKVIKNFSYDLANTPCENVINKSFCIYANNVQEIFPKDDLLTQMNVNSYVGTPLWDSSKKPIGLVALMDGKPMIDVKTKEFVLKIVALKIERILEKILLEEKLKHSKQELKQSKAKSKESETKFKKLSDLTIEGVLIHEKGVAIDVNNSLTKMFGYTKAELIGTDVAKLLHPKKYFKTIKKQREKNDSLPYVIEGLRKDGTVFPLEIEARNIKIENETYRVTAFRDITKRKKSEAENKKLKAAVEQSANVIVITDLEGNVEYTNPKFTETTGYTAEEVLGQNPRVLKSGKQDEAYYKELWDTITAGKTWSGQFENKAKDGTFFWEQATISPIKNDEGQIINFLAIKEDITERKKAEEKLIIAYEVIKEKEDYLSNILNTAKEGFWIIDTKGITSKLNLEMCTILGCSEKEVIGKSIFEYVDNKNKNIFIEQLKLREKGLSTSYEIALLNAKGENIPCIFNTSPIFDKNNVRTGSFALVTDISNLKKAYQTLENQNEELRQLSSELSKKNRLHLESKDRYRNLFEQSPVSLWEEDISEVTQLLKSKKREVKDLKKYLDSNPDFVLECLAKVKILNVNRITLDLLGVKTKEELITHLGRNFNKSSIEIFKKELIVIANNQLNFTGQTEFVKLNGEVINAIINMVVLKNQQKAIVSIIDITELRKAREELQIAKEKAEESNRLKTEFLNNMSHEIRTPMNGILGFSELLNEPNLDKQKRKYFVSIIQNSGAQLLHIIDEILEISMLGTKQVKAKNEEVNLNDLLIELFSIFDIKAKENNIALYLKKELSNKRSIIFTDKLKLNKILSNLIENALKFTSSGFVELGYHLVNNKLEIYVKDSGVGIKKEKQELIFERFSQAEKELSKKVGGLGLGLSIAKENTELLGGTISLDSEFKKGSTFKVTIPYNPVYKEIESEKIQSKKHTILIAEDEEVNFLFLEILLIEKLKVNANILHAKNGQEAVDMCKSNANIDLVLMDIKMPLMNGIEATKKIKEIRVNLPIIAQTAYSSTEDQTTALQAGCSGFISKPINKEKLKIEISKALK